MNLKKGKSVVIFILCLAIIVLCGYTAAFGLPGNKEHKGEASHITLGLDLRGGVSVTYHIKDEDFTKEQLNDTIYKLEQRVAIYSTESEVYKEGADNITVDIPGQFDAQAILEELGKPGSLMFVTELDGTETADVETYTVESTGTKYRVWVDGDDIAGAEGKAVTSEKNGAQEYQVALTFNKEGATKFEEATSANLNKSISILYDDQIISSPTVQSVITSGEAVITGQPTMEDANNLASIIRIGSLSLELETISSKVVSAKLGNDAVETSLFAGLVGLIIVMVFMMFMYRIPGVVASIALAFYTILELLVLNGFDLTLTLPGIAGVILSIGMAVDANVIIYARIKEEIGAGRTVDNAIKSGFHKAASAIIDGNVTTIIASVVLYIFGSGPVQGFAMTLGIGIVLSMFTALVISRLLIWVFYGMGFKDKKFYGAQKERKVIDFVGKKMIPIIIAVVCLCLGFGSMIVRSVKGQGAFNYSIEFAGGSSTKAEFEKEYSVDYFNKNIKPDIQKAIGDNEVHGQKDIDGNGYTIKTKLLTDDQTAAMKKVLVETYGAKLEAADADLEVTNISSSVSDKTRENAVIAVIIAVVCMLIYIAVRFRNFKFAFAAVIALLHDIFIVIGFYALSRISVGTTFIACCLTILGYSINATIVIFDRIRENIKAYEGKSFELKEVVNRSITDTLTRSIYTSFTTFVTIGALYVLGVTSIKEFALPIIVGIVAGGFSSVFLTGPIWYLMSKKKYAKKNK